MKKVFKLLPCLPLTLLGQIETAASQSLDQFYFCLINCSLKIIINIKIIIGTLERYWKNLGVIRV